MSLRKRLLVVVLTSFIVLVGPQAKLEVSVKEGEVAVLPCDVSALMNAQTSVDGLYLRWVTSDGMTVCDFNKGKTYCHGNSNRIKISRMNNTEFLLIINNTRFSDGGEYICWLLKQVGHGEYVTTVNLFVQGLEENRVLEEGQNLSVSLRSLNSLYIEFWGETENSKAEVCEVKGQAIHPGSGYLQRLTLLNGSLILSNLTAKDHGKYIVWEKVGGRAVLTLSLNISPKINPVPALKHVIGWPVGLGIAGIFVLVLIGISLYVYKWLAKRRMEQKTRERAEEMDQNISLCEKMPDRFTGGQGQEVGFIKEVVV